MTRERPRRRPMAEINVVPYIDVTLVLLIIFMVTAPLLQSGVDVNLPQAEAKPVATEDTPPLIVTVAGDGQFYVASGRDREAVEYKPLLARVAAELRLKPETRVLVAGDDQVPYGRVVRVMAALQEAGVEQVGLLTRPMQP
ncbi:MAG: protein TolR [Methylohalobius sp. ZOD2]